MYPDSDLSLSRAAASKGLNGLLEAQSHPLTEEESPSFRKGFFDRRALICGPEEGEASFLKRTVAARAQDHTSSEWKRAEARLLELFHCAPDWVEVEKTAQ